MALISAFDRSSFALGGGSLVTAPRRSSVKTFPFHHRANPSSWGSAYHPGAAYMCHTGSGVRTNVVSGSAIQLRSASMLSRLGLGLVAQARIQDLVPLIVDRPQLGVEGARRRRPILVREVLDPPGQ